MPAYHQEQACQHRHHQETAAAAAAVEDFDG